MITGNSNGVFINGMLVPDVRKYTLTHEAGSLPRITIECWGFSEIEAAIPHHERSEFIVRQPGESAALSEQLATELLEVITRHTADRLKGNL
jgi:hypothetical protein